MKKRIGRTITLLALSATIGITMPLSIFAASTKDTLQNKVNTAASAYKAESQALADAHKDTTTAKSQVSTLNAQSQKVLSEIKTISGQIDELSVQIAALQQQIADKEAEIAQKQAEYDQHRADFKARLAAMQELHDGGAMAMLSTATSLYQVLTFSDVLQDISQKDSATLDALEAERIALENAKAELTAAEQSLEETKSALQSKQDALTQKQNELANSIQQANATLSAAEAAEQAQEAITEETKKKWEAAVAEQDAYIKSQLSSSSVPSLTCGLNFQRPLSSYKYISTNFGDLDRTHSKPHAGTDFSAPAGTPILAVESGYISVARGSSSYGNYVVVFHGTASDGRTYATLYAHMTSYCVSAGQSVSRGDVIGYVGNTGRSFGNHLHLELWQNGIKINPLLYVPA